MKTVRLSRKERRANRSAAFHADRARKATSSIASFRAAADALVSAAKHAKVNRTARDLREQIAEHVHQAMDKAGVQGKSRDLYLQKLAEPGTEVERLGRALMCLQGAIKQLPDTERDRLIEHYITHFENEKNRINALGGVR
ncbi:hypothetical protein [Saccharopolyspora sp. NPDC002376]